MVHAIPKMESPGFLGCGPARVAALLFFSLTLLTGLGCNRSDDDTAITEIQQTSQALTESQTDEVRDLPYLKFLHNAQDELLLRQVYVPESPVLRGGLSLQGHQVRSLSWDIRSDSSSNPVEEQAILGNFAGPLGGSPVNQAGADGTSHQGRDFIVWVDDTQILVRELAPHGSISSTVVVHEAQDPVTSAPAIASFNGELVVIWAEDAKLQVSRSTDGETWSAVQAIDPTQFAYGPYLSLASFRGTLYLAYVLTQSDVFLSEIAPDFTFRGPNFNIFESSSLIVEASATIAVLNDEVLSVVFANGEGTHAIHRIGTPAQFVGPFALSTSASQHRPAAAYAHVGDTLPVVHGSYGETNLYVMEAGPSYTTLVQSADQLTVPGSVARFSFAASGPTRAAVLFNSAYAHQDAGNGLALSLKQVSECERAVTLRWQWVDGTPANLTGYEFLVNGEVFVTPSATQTITSPNPLRVTPDQDHTTQLRALFSDGSVRLSNVIPYRFEPCRQSRPLNVAVIQTKIENGPDSTFSLQELEEIFLSGTDSVADNFDAITDGFITLTGTVFDRNSLPISGNVSDYCENIDPDGWGSACGFIPILDQFNSVPSHDLYIFIIGGYAEAGEGGGGVTRQSGRPFKTKSTAIHEVGHVLGLNHANRWVCEGEDEGQIIDATPTSDASECTSFTYLNFLDPMGSTNVIGRHFGAFHGQLIGRLGMDQTVTADAGGEFTLQSVETANGGGLAEVRVPLGLGPNTFYSVEYRKGSPPLDIALNHFLNVFSNEPVEGVVVHLHMLVRPGNPSQPGENHLIRHLVLPGDPFIDPYRGIEIRMVESLSQDRARIEVIRSPLAGEAEPGVEAAGWKTVTGVPLQASTAQSTFGGSSLIVPGPGTTQLEAPALSNQTSAVAGDVLVLDVFVPGAQANPNYVGDVQAWVSAPSKNVFNRPLGTRALTPLLRDQWNELSFELDTEVRTLLLQRLPDVQFSFAFNLNSNLAPTYIDHLRFSGVIEHGGGFCGDGTLDPGEDCDDGNQSGGDSCPMDCRATGVQCDPSTAIDLGSVHSIQTIPADACLKVTDYPGSWIRGLALQTQGQVPSTPVPFAWSGCLGNGSGELDGAWDQWELRTVSSSCTTWIELRGDPNQTLALSWWGNG